MGKREREISTHAPHARRGTSKASKHYVERISTHAPHARRGEGGKYFQSMEKQFLLTRLMRGAARYWSIEDLFKLISTHAPHARRGGETAPPEKPNWISTHAPHARRGFCSVHVYNAVSISTHAPHARRGWTVRKDDFSG